MEHELYQIANGCYISEQKNFENDQYFSVYEANGKHWEYFYLHCDKSSEHIIIKEEDLNNAVKAIYPNRYFLTEDIMKYLAEKVNDAKPADAPNAKILKLDKIDGSATYYLANEYHTLKPVKFLQENLPLDDPKTIEKILAYSQIDWPVINATSKQLAAKMEARGYELEHRGRSGFESRNSIVIKTKDGILTPEIAQKIQQDLEQAKQECKQDKIKAFDKYFDEQSTDSSKVFALVETGYDYDLTRLMDEEKYEQVAKIRIGCTKDHRQGYDHMYLELLINKERIKEDKRKFIILPVPKEMIGKIIGKGGSNIKALQQKFGKRFNVVQDPKEIEAEKKRATEERAREHAYEISSLQNSIMRFMGDNFMLADDESIAITMVEYIMNNKDKLSAQPTQEEMQEMKQKLIAERDDRIARENQRKAEEIAYQKAEQLRLETEKKAEIEQTAKAHIQQYADEHNGAVIANEDFAKFITETYKDDELAQKMIGSVQKEFLLKMEAERAMQQRFAEAEKNFEKVTAEEFRKFFDDETETGGHGYDYFYIVGKARREAAYSMIAQQVSHRLGIYDDLKKRQNDRFLENWPQAGKIGSGMFPDYDFNDRVIAFEEAHRNDDMFSSKQTPEPTITKESEPAPEPTIDNLAALWGAKKGKLK